MSFFSLWSLDFFLTRVYHHRRIDTSKAGKDLIHFFSWSHWVGISYTEVHLILVSEKKWDSECHKGPDSHHCDRCEALRSLLHYYYYRYTTLTLENCVDFSGFLFVCIHGYIHSWGEKFPRIWDVNIVLCIKRRSDKLGTDTRTLITQLMPTFISLILFPLSLDSGDHRCDPDLLLCVCGTCGCPWGSPNCPLTCFVPNRSICWHFRCSWTASLSSRSYLRAVWGQMDGAAGCQSAPSKRKMLWHLLLFEGNYRPMLSTRKYLANNNYTNMTKHLNSFTWFPDRDGLGTIRHWTPATLARLKHHFTNITENADGKYLLK